MFWPNLYMSMDKSQKKSSSLHPATRRIINQSRVIKQISYEHLTLSSDVQTKPTKHEEKGCSHVWLLAKAQSEGCAWLREAVCETHGILGSPWWLKTFPRAAEFKNWMGKWDWKVGRRKMWFAQRPVGFMAVLGQPSASDRGPVPPVPAMLTPVLREGKGGGVKLFLSSCLTQVWLSVNMV